jgi:Ran GTPase-activating protein (RanGAP) involved in mRNA processing and transport
LKELDVTSNSVGDCGAVALSNAIRAGCFPSLSHLWLEQNDIGPAGVQALCDALCAAKTPLMRLTLSGNIAALQRCKATGSITTGIDSTKAIVSVLKQLSQLQYLALAATGIDGATARVLAAGLKHARNLATLDLSYNDIKDTGVMPLASVLCTMPRLTELGVLRHSCAHSRTATP